MNLQLFFGHFNVNLLLPSLFKSELVIKATLVCRNIWGRTLSWGSVYKKPLKHHLPHKLKDCFAVDHHQPCWYIDGAKARTGENVSGWSSLTSSDNRSWMLSCNHTSCLPQSILLCLVSLSLLVSPFVVHSWVVSHSLALFSCCKQ